MWNIPSKTRLNQIPRLYETETTDAKDKTIYLHFFIFGCDWYIAEYDGEDLFYGFAILNNDLQNAEWGYISFQELKSICINSIEVDCELESFWQSRPGKDIPQIKGLV